MGDYTGYRILAPIGREFAATLQRYLDLSRTDAGSKELVEIAATDPVAQLIDYCRGASSYFEFKVDNWGEVLEAEFLNSHTADIKPLVDMGSYFVLNLFFSAKVGRIDDSALEALGRHVLCDENCSVVFALTQTEGQRNLSYDGYGPDNRTEHWFVSRGAPGSVNVTTEQGDIEIRNQAFLSTLLCPFPTSWLNGSFIDANRLVHLSLLDAVRQGNDTIAKAFGLEPKYLTPEYLRGSGKARMIGDMLEVSFSTAFPRLGLLASRRLRGKYVHAHKGKPRRQGIPKYR